MCKSNFSLLTTKSLHLLSQFECLCLKLHSHQSRYPGTLIPTVRFVWGGVKAHSNKQEDRMGVSVGFHVKPGVVVWCESKVDKVVDQI